MVIITGNSTLQPQNNRCVFRYFVILFRICAYNEVTGEVYITQYLDCTTFSTTSSTILRFTPKVLISIQGNEKSVFFKQLEDDLEDTLIYFLPLSIVQCKADLSKFEKIVVKMQQLQNCFNCLMYTVQQHLSIQINKLPIQFYNLKEVMVFSKTTSQSLAIPELLKLFKPITNGGKRLLKANLLQPFSVAEQIEMRQKYTKHIQNLSESEISALKTYLNKFKSIDTLAQQQQQNTKRLIDQLQQIFRVYTYIKDLLNLNSFLKSIHLDGVMNMQLSKILESEEFNQIKYDIESQIDINLISHTNLDDEILYFILLNTDIQNDRQTMLDSKKEIQSLFQKYLSCFCIQMKCKKIKQNKYSIQCLRNGYVFEIAQQEAVRNNINEIDIKRIIEKEGDQVNFIDKNHQKINILTDKLAHLNLKLDTSINSIIKLTSDQINNLYQQLQLKCSWIFQVNQFISQLDVIQSFNQYVNTLNIYCYPQYNSQQFQIQEARYFKNNLETLSIKFNNFNVIYDHKEILSEQLKLVGQLIILSQIGCPVPCLQFNSVLVGQLYTHFQKYTIQNLAERQSSFTAEITSLNNILIGEHSDSLVLCDSLVLSSSHETNIALNLSFLEQLKQKIINGLFGSNEADTMQITELIQCNSMISRQEQICNIDQIELENILDNEFNADYKQNILQKLHNDLKFPQEFCQIMQRNFYVNSSV